MKKYLVTEETVDCYFDGDVIPRELVRTRIEVPMTAMPLTREQVEDLLYWAFVDAESSREFTAKLDELFGVPDVP